VVGGDFIGKMWFLARHLKSHGFMIADWWFGTWIMTFPSYWEWKTIPTDELHHFSEG
jgi:hypothetical protein